MKCSFSSRFLSVILCTFICRGLCTTWDDAKVEYEKLYNAYSLNYKDYYIDTIPTADLTQPIEVALEFELSSIGGYDAVNGALDVIGSLAMTWTDEIGTLSNANFISTLVSEVVVDYRTVWTPVLVLINSVDSVKRIGDETYKVRLNLLTGEAFWKPRIIISASCTPDVTYFPFDQQKCILSFAPWYYPKEKLNLSVSTSEWIMDNFDENGVWAVESTESRAYLSGDYYYADFTITFNREPTYFTVNLVLPILCLSLLSGFVFLLPAASGERVGFVITCFLSFVVLLQTMMTYLPQASAPMSLLCYYVIVMMTFSAFLCLTTAMLLRVYHKPKGETVPKWLIHFLEIIKCIKCRRVICRKNRNSIEDASTSSISGLYSEKGRLLEGGKTMPKKTVFIPPNLPSFAERKAMQNGEIITKTPAKVNNRYVVGSSISSGKTSSQSENGVINVTPISSHNGDIKMRNFNGKARDTNGRSDKSVKVPLPEAKVNADEDEDNMDEIDWEAVGHLLDTFFLLGFIGVQCGFSLMFLVPIGTRA